MSLIIPISFKTIEPSEALIRQICSIIAKRYVYKDKFLWNDEAD